MSRARRTRRRLARAPQGDRGAETVEFALIIVPLLVLFLGIVEFGFAMYSQITITQAAREAARHLSLNLGDAESVADSQASPLSVSSYSATACAYGANQSSSAAVTIKAPALGQVLANVIPGFPNLTVTGTASMPCGG